MKKVLSLLIFVLFIGSLQFLAQDKKVKNQKDFPAPPVAAIKTVTFEEFGHTRTDNYFWLREKENPEVIAYLNAENEYAETVMKETKDLQDKLYSELKSRIKEEDTSVPYLMNGYYYYSRTIKDQQYRVYCRKQSNLDAAEEIVFDVNKMAEGFPAFIFADFEISPDNKIAAYMSNTTGSYADFTLKFRILATGEDINGEITGVQSFAWANDSKTIFYVIGNEALRPFKLFRYEIGSSEPATEIFEEKDDLFNLAVGRSKTGDYLFSISESFTSSEIRFIKADNPGEQFRVFMPRAKDIEYSIDPHKDFFLVTYKDKENYNSKIYLVGLDNPGNMAGWKEIVPHNADIKIERVEIFDKFFVMQTRSNGLRELKLIEFAGMKETPVKFPEPVYTMGLSFTPEFNSAKFRYTYMSLNRPASTYDYDTETGLSILLKEQEVPGGFNSSDYAVERLWADAPDGKKVPMAIVYKKDLKKNGENPAFLYAYGSYGATTEAYFNSSVISLLDRGFVYGIAQVRGGSELGEKWYDDGKLFNKMNSFTDFIACSEKLIKEKYTSSEKLAVYGASAGGLLMGAIANLRPDLYKVIIAGVPFVDVINTMLDESLPLTTQEYEQWGNPNEEEAYRYILSYSPYDNIQAKNYPDILATGGLNDSQVGYHEPSKWVAKLRAMKTDDNITLLKINMDSGHGGATGRFGQLKEIAFEYAFILSRMGIFE